MSNRTRSAIWNYFILSDDKKKTKCHACDVELAYCGGTSSMHNHMKYVHNVNRPQEYNTALTPTSARTNKRVKSSQMVEGIPETLAPLQEAAVGDPSVCIQSSSTSHGSSTFQSITQAIAVMCAMDMLPVTIVNGRGFQTFCRQINHEYRVPSSSTVARHVDKLYNQTRLQLKAEISGCSMAFTFDNWMCSAKIEYISIIGHYITQDWRLLSRVLKTIPICTNLNMLKHLHDIQNEFGITCIPALVSDRSLALSSPQLPPHLDCFSNMLHISVMTGLEEHTVADAISAVKQLVSYLSGSTPAIQALYDHQIKMGTKNPLNLVQDDTSMWTSTFMLIQRILALRDPVCNVLSNSKMHKSSSRDSLSLSDDSWEVLEELVPVLEPLYEATHLLSSPAVPTASSVHTILANILPGLKETACNSSAINDVKSRIWINLVSRFELDDDGCPNENVLDGLLCTSAVLDPRFKSLKFVHSHYRDSILEHLQLLIESQEKIPVGSEVLEESSPHPLPPPAKRRLVDSLLADVIDSTTDQNTSIPEELRAYLTEPVCMSDPLAWWRANAKKFPRMARLARTYLCIPATDGQCGRSCDDVLDFTSRRAHLEPEHVDKLVFLHKNYVLPERLLGSFSMRHKHSVTTENVVYSLSHASGDNELNISNTSRSQNQVADMDNGMEEPHPTGLVSRVSMVKCEPDAVVEVRWDSDEQAEQQSSST